MKPYSSLIIAITSYLICSCSSEKQEEVVAKKEKYSSPKHIHEWKPIQPDLLNGQQIYVQECDTKERTEKCPPVEEPNHLQTKKSPMLSNL